MSKEVCSMVLLSKQLVPMLKQAAIERMRFAILSKYASAIVTDDISEEWCDGLCGVCETDCDDDHEHNLAPHAPGKHLQMVMTAETPEGD